MEKLLSRNCYAIAKLQFHKIQEWVGIDSKKIERPRESIPFSMKKRKMLIDSFLCERGGIANRYQNINAFLNSFSQFPYEIQKKKRKKKRNQKKEFLKESITHTRFPTPNQNLCNCLEPLFKYLL